MRRGRLRSWPPCMRKPQGEPPTRMTSRALISSLPVLFQHESNMCHVSHPPNHPPKHSAPNWAHLISGLMVFTVLPVNGTGDSQYQDHSEHSSATHEPLATNLSPPPPQTLGAPCPGAPPASASPPLCPAFEHPFDTITSWSLNSESKCWLAFRLTLTAALSAKRKPS